MKTIKLLLPCTPLVVILACLLLSCKNNPDAGGKEKEIDFSTLKPAVTPKGTTMGTIYTQQIGTDGGRVQSPDGQLTLDIPAGALSVNTTIGIQAITNEAPLGAGNGFRLSPEDVNFAKPITITMKYGADLQPGLCWIATQKSDGTWLGYRNTITDETAKTLSVQTTHFSDWVTGKLIDFRLSPQKATVKVKGQVQLYVNGFSKTKGTPQEELDELAPLIPMYPKEVDDEDLAPLPKLTDLSTRMEQLKGYRLDFKEWRLSPTTGKLKAHGSKATYTAPDKAPNPNTVNVSVDIEATRENKTIKLILLSQITIIDKYYAKFTINGVESVFTDRDIYTGGAYQPTGNMAALYVSNSGEFGVTFTHAVDQKTVSIASEHPKTGNMAFATSSNPAGTVSIIYLKTESTDGYSNATDELVKDGNGCKNGRSSTGSLTLTEYKNENGAIVSGSFSGTIWNMGDVMACKNKSVNISGEFVMPVNKQ
ncbi:hypothetical protein DU508_17130 [Pedobacter chinensis]|uniref:ZU5 domain-containing protein n=1 Tax=Pedobacter chinensis TaxID=2282421 RepID=A0A369PX49_9SPHI|nr:hypothetical protein [Pedobacter chinensis]RDC55296.1 hypothetical protein DU508_17130 [Pedobacter chinensis]